MSVKWIRQWSHPWKLCCHCCALSVKQTLKLWWRYARGVHVSGSSSASWMARAVWLVKYWFNLSESTCCGGDRYTQSWTCRTQPWRTLCQLRMTIVTSHESMKPRNSWTLLEAVWSALSGSWSPPPRCEGHGLVCQRWHASKHWNRLSAGGDDADELFTRHVRGGQ